MGLERFFSRVDTGCLHLSLCLHMSVCQCLCLCLCLCLCFCLCLCLCCERAREGGRVGGGAGQRARERGQSTHMICCIQIVTKCLNAHETGVRARSVPQPLRHVRSAARMLSNSRVSMSERHRQFDQSPNVGLSMKRENCRALDEILRIS
jgi:hypothetical protein